MKKTFVAVSVVAIFVSMVVLAPVAGAVAATYRLQLDAKPPAGEPWSFLRFFDEFLRKEAVGSGAKIGVEHAEEFRVLDLS